MSRAGYYDDWYGEGPPPEFWRQAVERAAKSKRGQQFMRDFRDALDAMPVKELVTRELRTPGGAVCALGAVGTHRNVDMSELLRAADDQDLEAWESDWECNVRENSDIMSEWFNIAPALVREVMYTNDEGNYSPENPAQRWQRMRRWVAEQIGESWNG